MVTRINMDIDIVEEERIELIKTEIGITQSTEVVRFALRYLEKQILKEIREFDKEFDPKEKY